MLKDLIIPTKEVTVGNTKVVLHPISIGSLGLLLQGHQAELEKVFNGKVTWDKVIASSPELTIQLILHSCKELDEYDKVAAMGFSDQLHLLQEISELTVPDEKQLIDFFRAVLAMIQRLPGNLGSESPKSEKTNNKKTKKLSSPSLTPRLGI